MASNIIKGMGVTCMLFVFGSKKVSHAWYKAQLKVESSPSQMLPMQRIVMTLHGAVHLLIDVE